MDRKRDTHSLWDHHNSKEKGLVNNQLLIYFRKTTISYSWPLLMSLRHQIYFCCLYCINQQRPKLNSWTCSRTQIPGWRFLFQCVQHSHLFRYGRAVLRVKGQPVQKKKVSTRHEWSHVNAHSRSPWGEWGIWLRWSVRSLQFLWLVSQLLLVDILPP